jgi:hypothetical protein
MSTGWKTTEFWLTATVVGGSVLTELSRVNILPPKYAALAAAISAGLYAIGRGLKKSGTGGGN